MIQAEAESEGEEVRGGVLEIMNEGVGFLRTSYKIGSEDVYVSQAQLRRFELRSGDLVIQLAAGCLISREDEGTTHGTPYLYDRAIPLVFWGPGIEAGRIPGPARTVDIAPTLTRRLGIAPPSGLDGRPLFD